MKRSLLGALLFLILVGEPTVGRTSGLFTPLGIITFALLYLSYFLLFDAIVYRYKLTNLKMVLVNFALYSVLITGLLHGELRDYMLHPHNDLITTLIRIQCSFFPLYAYPLLHKWAPGTKPAIKLSPSMGIFAASMLLLSLTRHFGIVDFLATFKVAGGIALFFSVAASAALLIALRRPKTSPPAYRGNSYVDLWCWIFLVVTLVPLFSFFIAVIVAMIPVSIYLLSQKSFRDSTFTAYAST